MFSHFIIIKLRSIISDKKSGEPKMTYDILKKKKTLLVVISTRAYALMTHLVSWHKPYTHMLCCPCDTAGSDRNLFN